MKLNRRTLLKSIFVATGFTLWRPGNVFGYRPKAFKISPLESGGQWKVIAITPGEFHKLPRSQSQFDRMMLKNPPEIFGPYFHDDGSHIWRSRPFNKRRRTLQEVEDALNELE